MIFAKVNQFLTWPIAYVFFKFIYKVEIYGIENWRKIKGPFVIVSNHVASYDSFAFRLALGFWAPHLPLRFMAVKQFDYWYLNMLTKVGIIPLIYWLFGVFIVVPGRGLEANLKTAEDIIKGGGHVVIYPEGKIVKKNTVAPFKRGASVLIQKTGVPVVPVSFRIAGEEGMVKKRLIIHINEPLKIDSQLGEEQITNILYEKIASMYSKDVSVAGVERVCA